MENYRNYNRCVYYILDEIDLEFVDLVFYKLLKDGFRFEKIEYIDDEDLLVDEELLEFENFLFLIDYLKFNKKFIFGFDIKVLLDWKRFLFFFKVKEILDDF